MLTVLYCKYDIPFFFYCTVSLVKFFVGFAISEEYIYKCLCLFSDFFFIDIQVCLFVYLCLYICLCVFFPVYVCMVGGCGWVFVCVLFTNLPFFIYIMFVYLFICLFPYTPSMTIKQIKRKKKKSAGVSQQSNNA